MAQTPKTQTPTPIRFGTDGWRGIMAEDFTFDNVRLCAQAVIDYLQAEGTAHRGLVLGYDTRFASKRFAEAVAEVAAGNEVPVWLCSASCPTPVASYAAVQRHAGGAVVITASHNPAEWNGFKFKPEYGGSAPPEVTDALEAAVQSLQETPDRVQRIPLGEAEQRGLVERFDPQPAYCNRLMDLVDVDRLRHAGLDVVVDSMHGAGSGYLKRVLEGGSTRVVEIRSDVNPAFPGMHNPEPIARNLQALVDLVSGGRAQVGLATDGDADRIGIIDERGTFVNQLQAYALLLFYLLEVRGQRGPAVRSITSTAMADRLGQEYGIPVYQTPVGFKYIGPKMVEVGAILGGEESGGFGFGGHIPERDGILAGLYVLDLLASRNRPLSQIVEDLEAQFGPSFYDRCDIVFSLEERDEISARVGRAESDRLAGVKVRSVDDSDGRRFLLADGSWLLIRFSGTEPLLRVYAEATSAEQLAGLLTAGRGIAGV